MRKSVDVEAPKPEYNACSEFKTRVAQVMKHDNLKQTEMAERLGMSYNNYHIRFRSQRISLDFAAKIAIALDVSLDWLCGLEDQ